MTRNQLHVPCKYLKELQNEQNNTKKVAVFFLWVGWTTMFHFISQCELTSWAMVWQCIKPRDRGFNARSKTSWLHNVKHGWSINSCHSFADVSSNKSASEADSSPALSYHPLKLWHLLLGWRRQAHTWETWLGTHPGQKTVSQPNQFPDVLHCTTTLSRVSPAQEAMWGRQPVPASRRTLHLHLYLKKHPQKPSHLAGSNLLRYWQLNSVRTSSVLNQASSAHNTLTLCLVKYRLSSYILHKGMKSPN